MASVAPGCTFNCVNDSKVATWSEQAALKSETLERAGLVRRWTIHPFFQISFDKNNVFFFKRISIFRRSARILKVLHSDSLAWSLLFFSISMLVSQSVTIVTWQEFTTQNNAICLDLGDEAV